LKRKTTFKKKKRKIESVETREGFMSCLKAETVNLIS